MNITDSIINYRGYFKRRNCSASTVRSYLSHLKQFILWLDEPIELVGHKKVTGYVDYLLGKKMAPKTINCHLVSIHSFYDYLVEQEELQITNPVKKGYHLRLARPLPKHLQDEQVVRLFSIIKSRRDRAMFMLMLRCGLRVREVANLTIDAVDWRRRRLYVYHGKGDKDRVVYISDDTYAALVTYVKQRLGSRVKKGVGNWREKDLSEREGPLQGQALIHTRHPQADRVLRKKIRGECVLPSAPAHDGHPAAQRRCGSGDHPGSFRTHPHQDHPALLPGVQPEGST